jgi:phosphoribosylamine--glycine ligase
MRILVIGTSPSAHFISQFLANQENLVYHFGANVKNTESENYKPLFFSDEELLNFLDTVNVDLIFPVQLKYFKPEIQKKLSSLSVPCLIPNIQNSLLEWSKIKTKKLLKELEIPSPNYFIMTKQKLYQEYFNIPRPFVIKHEQTWKHGSQTIIITDENYLDEYKMLIGDEVKGISKSDLIIIEKFISSKKEISYHVLCNGTNFTYLGSARDYKKINDGDVGYNTDGIGSYSDNNSNVVIDSYVNKILSYLEKQNNPYLGIMYLGIIINDGVPEILEINVRPGCPEIQSILPTIETNLANLLYNNATQSKRYDISFNQKKVVSVAVIPKNYRLSYDDERVFIKLTNIPENIIYSTDKYNTKIVFTSVGNDLAEARKNVYDYLDTLNLVDYHYRSDIGYLK